MNDYEKALEAPRHCDECGIETDELVILKNLGHCIKLCPKCYEDSYHVEDGELYRKH